MYAEQLKILCLVRAGNRRLRELADMTRLSHSAAYYHIGQLERKGFIEHVFGNTATLRLTEAGRQAIKDYFLIYPKGGGIQLGRMVKDYVSSFDASITTCARTGT